MRGIKMKKYGRCELRTDDEFNFTINEIKKLTLNKNRTEIIYEALSYYLLKIKKEVGENE